MKKFVEKNYKIIEKPARYMGGELNSITQFDFDKKVSNCFCFPDVYEVGMSHIGMKILYEILNGNEICFCERCFAPWPDLGKLLKENGELLCSLESDTPLKDFDAVHFTFQYEFSYTNFLWMLELAGIPKFSKDRGNDYPIIFAGGPCSVNLEPIADFVDVVILGDGEEVNLKIQKYLLSYKQHRDKEKFLKDISEIRGVYIPAFVQVEKNGRFIIAKTGQNKIKKAIVEDLNFIPYITNPIVPNIKIVHDRGAVELFRGCTRGCRFCQAGFYYRPLRERSSEIIRNISKNIIQNTGYDELSLFSLSTGDYPNLPKLISDLKEDFNGQNVKFAFPSLRLDSFDGAFALYSRKSSLTFAPEAGTQRLRDVINKNITEQQILSSLSQAFKSGYDGIKLYFIIGLPTETEEDIIGIVNLAKNIKKLYQDIRGVKRIPNITVSTSIFIPKPFTPFCYERHISKEEAIQKINLLRDMLKAEKIIYDYHDIDASYLETVLARGDRSLAKVILKAQESGCIFDSWMENFDINKWKNILKECDVDADNFISEIPTNQVLPWEIMDIGVSKEYLLSEREKAYNGCTTRDCRQVCTNCGMKQKGWCNR